MLPKCISCEVDMPKATSRKRFCSNKCKMAFLRNNTVTSTVTNVTEKDDSVTERVTQRVTEKTDKLFQEDAIKRGLGEHWLTFTIVREYKCSVCFNKFKTKLAMLRHCSPNCRDKELHIYSDE